MLQTLSLFLLADLLLIALLVVVKSKHRAVQVSILVVMWLDLSVLIYALLSQFV